ncbi:hypothetical protein QUB75_15955 [Microcoleus sp. K1-B6]|uniref:hypothetical protein n=1 Tax=Microcoleus sp. K1-B1 TaxID=2818782 RepID=UPI002FD5E49A
MTKVAGPLLRRTAANEFWFHSVAKIQSYRRRKKEEGRRKKEEGRRKKEEGRRKKEEGRRKKEEGRRN